MRTDVKLLLTIAHYFHIEPNLPRASSRGENRRARLEAFIACISALYRQFGSSYVLDLKPRNTRPANQAVQYELTVVVCTTRGRHLLCDTAVPRELFVHRASNVEPVLLEFECHAVLREALGRFNYYCFLEDDLVIQDPWFFAKLKWFSDAFGPHCLLQPNRYEAPPSGRHKLYVDGEIPRSMTEPFQDISAQPELRAAVLGRELIFQRARNPHAACFFLNEEQMRHWAGQPYFLDRDTSFVGPIESSATLGVMKTFRVYKTAVSCANFLEILHFNPDFSVKMGDRLLRRRGRASVPWFQTLLASLQRKNPC